MNLLLNLLWIFLGGGIVVFTEYLIGGLLLCLTIVGIPFGVQAIKLSVLGLAPFGVEIVEGDEAPLEGVVTGLLNVIWVLVAGIWIALTHLILAIGLAVTIIGIPFAVQHFKFAKMAFTPFGRKLRRVA